MDKAELCDYCCDWVYDNRERHRSPAAVMDSYKTMMRKVLKVAFHMPKEAADEFIATACIGNWDRLHESRIEKRVTAEGIAEILLDEVHYFSDRWSWDRVLRAQWLYHRLRDRISNREDECA